MSNELQEQSKLAWRALVEAERVIDTIEPEDEEEAEQLGSLQTRITHIAQNLFYLLRLEQSDVEALP